MCTEESIVIPNPHVRTVPTVPTVKETVYAFSRNFSYFARPQLKVVSLANKPQLIFSVKYSNYYTTPQPHVITYQVL